MGMTPEGKIKKKLDTMLKSYSDVWYFAPQSGPFGSSGIPDRIACCRGLLIGIECKADKTKKLTALQAQCLAKIEDAGGIGFTVYDDNTIAAVKEYIEGHIKNAAAVRMDIEPMQPRINWREYF